MKLFLLFLTFLITFFSFGQLKDIDGNFYKTVTIGNQNWMAENLKVSHLNNGVPINLVRDSITWDRLTSPGFCFPNNNNISLGGLYNYYAVQTDKLCPIGWHVSTNYDWEQLFKTIGGQDQAGMKLKSTYGWESSESWCRNKNGINTFGFNILNSGVRGTSGKFIGNCAHFWTGDQSHYYFFCTETMIRADYSNEISGYSVRCVEDTKLKNTSSGALSEIEYLFGLNSGELFRFVQEKLSLSEQKFVSNTKVRFSNEKGTVIFEFLFFDSSLERIKDLTIFTSESSLNSLFKNELENNPNFQKITVNKNMTHYKSSQIQYVLGQEKTDKGEYYIIMIY